MSLNRGQPNFARCLAVSCDATLYIHFWGLLPLNGILSGAKFTLRPSLAFSYIGSITAGHSQCASAKLCGVVCLCDRVTIPVDIGQSNCLVFIYFLTNSTCLLVV